MTEAKQRLLKEQKHKVQACDQEVVPSRHKVLAGTRTCNTESWAVGGEGEEAGGQDVEADRGVETVAAGDDIGNLQVDQEAGRAEGNLGGALNQDVEAARPRAPPEHDLANPQRQKQSRRDPRKPMQHLGTLGGQNKDKLHLEPLRARIRRRLLLEPFVTGFRNQDGDQFPTEPLEGLCVTSEHRSGASKDSIGGAAASLGDSAVANEDAGILAAASPSAGRETTAPDVSAWDMGDSSPAKRLEAAPRLRFLRREEDMDLTAGAEESSPHRYPGVGLPHAPSVPAAEETAKPPDLQADVS
ncbi:hypothetical protein CRENBAI_019222 [Crenichthys baileyi]|uniref:Uncharacterized protein n=1 Tax=Crenichthys baileyi TaxID=28760 RepID=A0AAV9S3Y7_9TELE